MLLTAHVKEPEAVENRRKVEGAQFPPDCLRKINGYSSFPLALYTDWSDWESLILRTLQPYSDKATRISARDSLSVNFFFFLSACVTNDSNILFV